MILHTTTPTEINRELKKDLEWIVASVKKKAKKLKMKIIASGITHREVVEEYPITSPLNNRWFVTYSFCLNRKIQLQIKACCIVESEYGTPDYFILRGLTFGSEYHIRITSHTISRMKERDIRFRDMSAGQTANSIIPYGEDGMGVYTREENIPKSLEEWLEKKDGRKNLFMTTSTGVFFGFQEIIGGHGNLTIKTFVTPDMLYTHKEQQMYRFCEANLQLQKHMKTVYQGNVAMSMIDNSPEANKLIEIIKEYQNEMTLAPEIIELNR